MIHLKLPIKTESEANKREHWAKKYKRSESQRAMAMANLKSEIAKRGKVDWNMPIVVKLTRIGKRRLDDDNLARSFKAVRDGIADALNIDDGSDCLRWHYAQTTGKEYAIEVGVM